MPRLVVLLCLALAAAFAGCATTAPVDTRHAYGERVTFQRPTAFRQPAALLFPDFALLSEGSRSSQFGALHSTAHTFAILDRQTKERLGEVSFVMSGAYLTPSFTVAGRHYALEMYYTVGPAGTGVREQLKSNQLVVWDADTARARHPELYNWTWIQQGGFPRPPAPKP